MDQSMKKKITKTLVIAMLLMMIATGAGRELFASQEGARFNLNAVMIPMRDGIRLNTHIFVPAGFDGKKESLPIILERTPYQAPATARNWSEGKYKSLAADGYIFVIQDIRGRYKSEGRFVMQRAPESLRRDKPDPQVVDEVTDAWDTIEWLTSNIPGNNGRVGIIGISYPGWTAAMATLKPHPALKAASPQASPADMFIGDDFHHNGAFRLSYGFEYATMMETSKESYRFTFDRYDTFDWYLALGSLNNVNRHYLHGKIPTWNDFVEHPNYDAFWQTQAMAGYLQQVNIPMLNVAGWWDQEDFYGPLKIYEALEKHDTRRINYLVAGPWNHGGWARGEGSSLGRIAFDSPTARHYREQIEAPWFAFWLKDRGRPGITEAITFRTGANEWRSDDQWPPVASSRKRQLYLHANGRISFDPPTESGSAFDSYISDPANPVPYRARPIEPTYSPRGSGWSTWLVEDQRFANRRPDVLSWQTEPLTEEVTIQGEAIAHLFASTSGTDSDWIVKLIDVYPEEYDKDPKMGGFQLMVANDVMRGRFRRGFIKPEPMVPNRPTAIDIDLHHLNHRFGRGHRIMVQVQSTWFPVIDRNPQRFVPNIFKAVESDFIRTTQRIHRSKSAPSHIEVSVAIR